MNDRGFSIPDWWLNGGWIGLGWAIAKLGDHPELLAKFVLLIVGPIVGLIISTAIGGVLALFIPRLRKPIT